MVNTSNAQQIPVNVVGSSVFGRYPKISLEKTYNMFISDNWLVNYAGFIATSVSLGSGKGRGLFHSIRGNFLIAVISSSVYKISNSFSVTLLGNLDTSINEVTIDENLSGQIAIADSQNIYIYSYVTGSSTIVKQNLTYLGNPINPNYVSYHNTFFLIGSNPVSANPQLWYAATIDPGNPDNIIIANTDAFSLQTKPDFALAVLRLPGKGNNVIVFGSAVAEIWTQVGGTENYRRAQSINIDQGCVSVNTIAANEEFVCWLGQNENNAPSIMVTNGSQAERISNDGIDYLLQSINRPDLSTAFFYRQDGHLFYQITFFDPSDNLTLAYDFNTKQFFHISDENLNYHPARQIVYFNENIYFISINDNVMYEMGTKYVTYNYTNNPMAKGDLIPRIRICKTIRKEDNDRFRVGMFSFWLEQGVTDYIASIPPSMSAPRIDMSISKNGNQSFSNVVSRPLNSQGVFRNQIRWQQLGSANEFTIQLSFVGFQRFVAMNGVAEIY